MTDLAIQTLTPIINDLGAFQVRPARPANHAAAVRPEGI